MQFENLTQSVSLSDKQSQSIGGSTQYQAQTVRGKSWIEPYILFMTSFLGMWTVITKSGLRWLCKYEQYTFVPINVIRRDVWPRTFAVIENIHSRVFRWGEFGVHFCVCVPVCLHVFVCACKCLGHSVMLLNSLLLCCFLGKLRLMLAFSAS